MPEPDFDEEDVAAALKKTNTADGPGVHDLDSLPQSDFVSFATEDVED